MVKQSFILIMLLSLYLKPLPFQNALTNMCANTPSVNTISPTTHTETWVTPLPPSKSCFGSLTYQFMCTWTCNVLWCERGIVRTELQRKWVWKRVPRDQPTGRHTLTDRGREMDKLGADRNENGLGTVPMETCVEVKGFCMQRQGDMRVSVWSLHFVCSSTGPISAAWMVSWPCPATRLWKTLVCAMILMRTISGGSCSATSQINPLIFPSSKNSSPRVWHLLGHRGSCFPNQEEW